MKHRGRKATVSSCDVNVKNDSEPLFSNSCVNWMLGC